MNKKKSNIAKFFLDLPLGAEFQVKVQTASMSPLLKVGDSVLVKKTEFNQVETGDAICFYQDPEKSLIIHRVVDKQCLNNKQSFKLITKGDALINVDFNSVHKKNFVGLVMCKAKKNSKNGILKKLLFIFTQRIFLRHQLIRDFFY
jgi:signal peptidase I